MKALLPIGSSLSGVTLVTAVVCLGGFVAAIPILRAYFLYFGSEHKRLAFAFLDGFMVKLPTLLVSLGWCWLTQRINPPPTGIQFPRRYLAKPR
jgi:hypothetical protein